MKKYVNPAPIVQLAHEMWKSRRPRHLETPADVSMTLGSFLRSIAAQGELKRQIAEHVGYELLISPKTLQYDVWAPRPEKLEVLYAVIDDLWLTPRLLDDAPTSTATIMEKAFDPIDGLVAHCGRSSMNIEAVYRELKTYTELQCSLTTFKWWVRAFQTGYYRPLPKSVF